MDNKYDNFNSFVPSVPDVKIQEDLTLYNNFPEKSDTALEIFKLIYTEEFIKEISYISYKYFEQKIIEEEGINYKNKNYSKNTYN